MGKAGKRAVKLIIVLAIIGGVLYYFKDDLLGRLKEYKQQDEIAKQMEELIAYTIEAQQIQCETTPVWTESGETVDFFMASKYISDREQGLIYEQHGIITTIYQIEEDKKIKYQYAADEGEITFSIDENGNIIPPEGLTWRKTEADELEGSEIASGRSDTISYGYLTSGDRLVSVEQLEDTELDGETVQKYKATLKRRLEYEPNSEEEWEKTLAYSGMTDEYKEKYPEIYEKLKEMNDLPDTEEMYFWVKDQKLLQIQTDNTREFYMDALMTQKFDECMAHGVGDAGTIQKYKYNEECDPITLPAEYVE